MKRTAASAPVALFRLPGVVEAVLDEMRRLVPGREALHIDVWIRRSVTAEKVLEKHQLTLLFNPGDIDRQKVFPETPLSSGPHRVWHVCLLPPLGLIGLKVCSEKGFFAEDL